MGAVSVINAGALTEALALLPPEMDSDKARLMVLAACTQESELVYRKQHGGGPARGLAQFEQGNEKSRGGVWGVLNNPRTTFQAMKVANARGVSAAPAAVWAAMETDDVLALAYARLLLWADPRPLPAIGDVDGAWSCYLRCWNPGRPRPEKWPKNYNFVRKGLGL